MFSVSSKVKFIFSKKATKLTESSPLIQHYVSTSKCQINGEDFFDFCGLLRKVFFSEHTKYPKYLTVDKNWIRLTLKYLKHKYNCNLTT